MKKEKSIAFPLESRATQEDYFSEIALTSIHSLSFPLEGWNPKNETFFRKHEMRMDENASPWRTNFQPLNLIGTEKETNSIKAND